MVLLADIVDDSQRFDIHVSVSRVQDLYPHLTGLDLKRPGREKL